MPRPGGRGTAMAGSMTVGELRERLADFPEDAEVFFTYNYGDHRQSTVAAVVDHVEEGSVKWSDYFRMNRVVGEEEDEETEEVKKVVLIG